MLLKPNSPNQEWRKLFDDRQQREINFDEIYATQFNHGTDGHNARLIIARFVEICILLETKGVDVKGIVDEMFTGVKKE